ncbi:MAG TPA: S8 family peptidase [Bacteroidia bacterium]|jgi:subtilisin family serine protease|nr:S8 family peptidase [Bacteroidia bacterium]
MYKYLFAILLFSSLNLFAQDKDTHPNWQLQDPAADKVYGVSAEKAYQLLKGRTPKPVIVAVIDGGTDITHEDLKAVIWTNTGEIPGNGIDDDHNGYVDDVHGWNFLGGKNGNIDHESSELARLYHRLGKKYANVDTSSLKADDRKEYAEYKKIKAKFSAEQMQLLNQMMVIGELNTLVQKIKKENNGKLTRKGVKKYKPVDDREKAFKRALKIGLLLGGNADEFDKEINDGMKQLSNSAKYNNLNTDSIRMAVVGDDPYNLSDRNYGNNDVIGPEALHGTHVAGIIAASRNNNLGINGVADNVQIMVVRAVPDGDERDKDVANAIRYAVDNHASIINMSFGKYYSPGKQAVDEAIQYAADHDVLLIHAAGNESKNKDEENSFPTNELNSGKVADNWIEVGASDRKKGSKLLGSFSNYGKKHLDLFAPGVGIYSTGPGNTYINESGTSMAAPVTTGVAAMIREYFPELKAAEVKAVLMKTVTPYTKKVETPGQPKQKQLLSDMSVSGGIVNAYNAVNSLLKK